MLKFVCVLLMMVLIVGFFGNFSSFVVEINFVVFLVGLFFGVVMILILFK